MTITRTAQRGIIRKLRTHEQHTHAHTHGLTAPPQRKNDGWRHMMGLRRVKTVGEANAQNIAMMTRSSREDEHTMMITTNHKPGEDGGCHDEARCLHTGDRVDVVLHHRVQQVQIKAMRRRHHDVQRAPKNRTRPCDQPYEQTHARTHAPTNERTNERTKH